MAAKKRSGFVEVAVVFFGADGIIHGGSRQSRQRPRGRRAVRSSQGRGKDVAFSQPGRRPSSVEGRGVGEEEVEGCAEQRRGMLAGVVTKAWWTLWVAKRADAARGHVWLCAREGVRRHRGGGEPWRRNCVQTSY